MMKVWRIENKEGDGPYSMMRDNENLDFLFRHNNNLDRWPPPTDDDIDEIRPEEVFGFASQESLYLWFGDDLERLEENGFYITCYESNYVRHGFKQVVFVKGERIF